MGHGVVIALDVGGTGIKGAIFGSDLRGEPLATHAAPTNADKGADQALESVLAASEQLIQQALDLGLTREQIHAVGLCVPGIVDPQSGMVIAAKNLGWHDLALRDIAQQRLGIPVAFGHDVRTGCLAEWKLSSRSAVENLVFLPIGTGIAAALVINGQLITNPYAGEVGHGGYHSGEACPCGGIGCPDIFASARGIARTYNARTGKTVPGAAEVLAAMRAGDVDAAVAWDTAIAGLASIVAQIVRVNSPEVVIMGGGLVQAGAYLLEPLRAGVQELLTVHRMPQIVAAEYGASAGMRGAAYLAWDAHNAATTLVKEPVSHV